MKKKHSRNTAYVKCTNKSDTSNNMGNWNHMNRQENC